MVVPKISVAVLLQHIKQIDGRHRIMSDASHWAPELLQNVKGIQKINHPWNEHGSKHPSNNTLIEEEILHNNNKLQLQKESSIVEEIHKKDVLHQIQQGLEQKQIDWGGWDPLGSSDPEVSIGDHSFVASYSNDTSNINDNNNNDYTTTTTNNDGGPNLSNYDDITDQEENEATNTAMFDCLYVKSPWSVAKKYGVVNMKDKDAQLMEQCMLVVNQMMIVVILCFHYA